MASPAKITEVLPDTLPDDFGEWDSAESPSSQPANPGNAEPAPGLGIVPKPANQPAETQAAAAPSGNLLRGTPLPTPAKDFADDGAFLHRVRSLSPAAERAEVVVPRQMTAAAIDEVRFSAPRSNGAAVATPRKPVASAPAPAPAVTEVVDRKPPVAQATAMSEADEVLFHSFRTNTAEAVQPKPVQKNWAKIAAIGGASAVVVVLLVMIPLFHHSKASAPKAATVAQPSVTVIEQPDANLDKPSPAITTTAAAPAKSQDADHSNDSSSDAQPAADQPSAGPSDAQSQLMNEQLNAPARIQRTKADTSEVAPPPSGGFGIAGMDQASGSNPVGSVFGSQSAPKVQAAAPKIVNVSAGVAVGLLVQKTPPVYPQIAKAARVSGTVVLQASISKTGAIQNLRVVSGPVMLRQAAVDAVRTWHYKPYRLNNEPVDIETTINVIFSLAG
jgi:periplasmic protein TonB